jgi:hypothetical protein
MAINKQFLVLHPSWIQRIQEGFQFNLIFFGTVLVSSPPIQASEVSVSSNRSLSPTLRDSSGAGIVSPSSLVNDCLDGSGGDSFEGEEFISGVAFMTSATSTDAINRVFDLLAGVHGPGTFAPSALGLWSDLFTGTVALIFELHFWACLLMQEDGVGHHLPFFLSSVFI